MADWDDWGDSSTTTTAAPKAAAQSNSGNDWGDDWGASGGSSANTGGGGGFGGGGGGRGGGGPRGPMKCYNCQEEGHRSNECTNPKKERTFGDRPPRACFNCGETGHNKQDCPNPRKMTCYNCQGEGHTSRDCTQPKKPREGGSRRNDNAGDDWGATNGASTTNDNNGGDFNWDLDDKPKQDQAPRERSGNPGECRRCKKEGHMAKDCTEELLGPDGKPLPPIYKPKELDENDENLYDVIPSGINFDKYDKIKVNITGEDAPKPILKFEDQIRSETLLKAIEKCNYKVPTPIQKSAIPIILAGRDLMGCAQTGSGKTAAFILPILQTMFDKLNDLPSQMGSLCQEPWCVIVSPTRELAIQIHVEAVKFSKDSVIRPQLIYGGTSSGYQKSQIQRGTHFLVATPGRLLDFVDKGFISFASLKFLVLDEADRMIDQGFLPEIRRIEDHPTMPDKKSRQTLMFSATFPDDVQRLARDFLNNYLFLTVGVVGAANSDVQQTFLEVNGREKRSKLMDILAEAGVENRILIFVEKKKTADFLAAFVSQTYKQTTSIHGDRFQQQRETALYDFRSGRMPVLVATSVAARGLDIKDVKHVINYDLPKEIDEYVHRIGRTGRVGNLGKATSFFDSENPQDMALVPALVKILEMADQIVPEFLVNAVKKSGSFGGDFSGGGSFGGTDIRQDVPMTSNDDWD